MQQKPSLLITAAPLNYATIINGFSVSGNQPATPCLLLDLIHSIMFTVSGRCFLKALLSIVRLVRLEPTAANAIIHCDRNHYLCYFIIFIIIHAAFYIFVFIYGLIKFTTWNVETIVTSILNASNLVNHRDLFDFRFV